MCRTLIRRFYETSPSRVSDIGRRSFSGNSSERWRWAVAVGPQIYRGSIDQWPHAISRTQWSDSEIDALPELLSLVFQTLSRYHHLLAGVQEVLDAGLAWTESHHTCEPGIISVYQPALGDLPDLNASEKPSLDNFSVWPSSRISTHNMSCEPWLRRCGLGPCQGPIQDIIFYVYDTRCHGKPIDSDITSPDKCRRSCSPIYGCPGICNTHQKRPVVESLTDQCD